MENATKPTDPLISDSTDTEINLDNINLEGQLDEASKKDNKTLSSSNSAKSLPKANMSKENIAGTISAGMFSHMTSNFNINAFKPNEWISKRRETLKPWGEFVHLGKLKKPASPAQAGMRLVKNINHFQSNYLFVFVFLAIYCVLTSPFLLIAMLSFMGGCYILYLKNKDGNLKVFGKELSLAQLYTFAGICSVPIFLLAGAGSAVFWIIGASICVIILHAIFYAREEQEDPFTIPTMDIV